MEYLYWVRSRICWAVVLMRLSLSWDTSPMLPCGIIFSKGQMFGIWQCFVECLPELATSSYGQTSWVEFMEIWKYENVMSYLLFYLILSVHIITFSRQWWFLSCSLLSIPCTIYIQTRCVREVTSPCPSVCWAIHFRPRTTGRIWMKFYRNIMPLNITKETPTC